MPKIYDCVMFFNELDMLELRMNILSDVVDYFVVCEAEETHSGQPKRLNFLDNYARFKQWHSKIIYVNAGELSNGNRNSWQREYYHRTRISEGLHSAQGEDWIIVGDCDEIPHPAYVSKLLSLPSPVIVKFELDFFYYDFNHRVSQGWSIGAAAWGYNKDPNAIRTSAGWGQERAHPIGNTQFNDAGWHFSYFGGPEAILEKHAAFMHHADPGVADLPHDPAYIADKVQASLDLYGRDLQVTHVPTSDGLPQYVLDNADKYRQMGWLE